MRRSLLAIVAALLGACTGSAPGGEDSGPPDGTDAAMATMDSGAMAGVDAGGDGVDAGEMGIDTGTPMGCPYPEGAVEPMALGAVLWPYTWPESIYGDGTNVPLDLTEVYCTADPNIDWSPFDVLLFISIPAW